MCGIEANPSCRKMVTLVERNNPPFHDCTSASPPFAMGRLWEVYLERTSQLEKDWKVDGVEGCEGALIRI